MLKLLTVIALFGVALAQRNPNPCEGIAEGQRQWFRNDYSTCEDYFWCNEQNAIPTGPCRPTFNFHDAYQACNQGFVCEECPVTGTIAVGVTGDLTCTQYTFCIEGVRSLDPPRVCPIGTMFNRVTGVCDLADNVVCLASDAPPAAPGCINDLGDPITGDIWLPPACDTFAFCNAGVLETVEPPHSCGALHFNPTTGTCDLPANLDPPCTAAIVKTRTPKAKQVSGQLTFRERIAKKLRF